MTPRQIELARHALGLPNKFRKSYRNRFFAGPGHADFFDWCVMVVEGQARYTLPCPPYRRPTALPMFYLTDVAAVAVLKKGELIDHEDFIVALKARYGG